VGGPRWHWTRGMKRSATIIWCHAKRVWIYILISWSSSCIEIPRLTLLYNVQCANICKRSSHFQSLLSSSPLVSPERIHATDHHATATTESVTMVNREQNDEAVVAFLRCLVGYLCGAVAAKVLLRLWVLFQEKTARAKTPSRRPKSQECGELL
jgi:hypothetical protein